MELKRERRNDIPQQADPFNRTFMELKHRHIGAVGLQPVSFNRTFMELKPAIERIDKKANVILLIAPLWN